MLMLRTQKRVLCSVALLLALLLPLTVEAQRGRAAQIINIRVRANETVVMLAERYGVAAEEIARLNNIEPNAQLQPGTVNSDAFHFYAADFPAAHFACSGNWR